MSDYGSDVRTVELSTSATRSKGLTGQGVRGMRSVLRLLGRIVLRNAYTRSGAVLLFGFIFAALIGPFLLPDQHAQGPDILKAPTPSHWFGTDHLGRDILTRSLAGARVSILVAIASVLLGLIVALPLGLIAGYFTSTWIDDVIMRATDVLMAFPLFMLALVLLAITGPEVTRVAGLELPAAWKVIVLIAIATVPKFIRVARSATLVEREQDYVAALRVVGVSRRAILFQEVILNVLPPTMVQAFLWMAIAVSAEAALSFLGLGVPAPDATLGNMLYDARNYLPLGAWWYTLFPGSMILMLTVGLNLLGDGLSDLLDPQLRL
jgi:peptide/nickel transport system permease protein